MTPDELSLQYHSLRFYRGTYIEKNVNYRIGDTTTVVKDKTERYYDTWTDFHLIPSERPVVNPPRANTKIVTIPGKKDPIDLTYYATGHPTYMNRTGQWTFFIDNDFLDSYQGGWVAFDKYLRGILHGHIYKIELRDDPLYFYAGEISLSQLKPGSSNSTISMTYVLYPYKKSKYCTLDMWKFDDFSFVDGVIMYMKDMEINGSRIVDVIGSTERVSPHISGTSGIYVDKFENNVWVNYGVVPTDNITSQGSIIPRFIINNGLNRIRFRGNGTVTVDYRRGLL